jgi:signal transduction histidine kinase
VTDEYGMSGTGRGGDHTILPIDGFFDGKPPALVFALGVAFVAVVGTIDHFTGADVAMHPFYLMPIVLVTWNLGRRFGVVIVALAVLACQLSELSGPVTNALIPSWNAIGWAAVSLFVVWLLSGMKAAVRLQRRQIELEHEAAEALRRTNALKDTLLHAVSHDLKGPLAGIIGAMQAIRRAEELRLAGAEMDSLYEVVEVSGAKMNRLVDDMLDLERVDRGQVELERAPTDVAALARRVVSDSTGVTDHPVDVSADEVLADVDRAKVERVLENLLVNAGRHTPAGTPIHVRMIASSDGVVLEVEDEGPGVPEALRDVVFDPFRQGAGAGGRGVGIGLSLVRRFAQLHGGDAEVADRPGGGARFVVTLPGSVQPVPVAVPDGATELAG